MIPCYLLTLVALRTMLTPSLEKLYRIMGLPTVHCESKFITPRKFYSLTRYKSMTSFTSQGLLKHAQPTDPLTYLHTTRSRYKHQPKKTGDGNIITNGHAITVLIVSTRATTSFVDGPKRMVDRFHLEKCPVIIGGMWMTVCSVDVV